MTRRITNVWLLVSGVAVVAMVAMLLTIPTYNIARAADVAQQSEAIEPLHNLNPEEGRTPRAGAVVIGGVKYDDGLAWRWVHQQFVDAWRYDTATVYDLLEMRIGVVDDYAYQDREPPSVEVEIRGDGRSLHRQVFKMWEQASFVWVPLSGVRMVEFRTRSSGRCTLALANARLVSGRTEPTQPIEMYITEGMPTYIERPGEYVFRLRK